MPPAFRTLLVAKTISALGSQVSIVALPLTANTPANILARIIGALTTVIGASAPLGAVTAGAIASIIGLRPTLILDTAGFRHACAGFDKCPR